jgi:preprotein translocase subunit YajC
MLVSTAHAQAAGGGSDMMLQLMPLLLIFVVFYFLLIRPQQKKAKEHRAMVAAVQRGDSVLTAGGIFGKVTKVIDEFTVQVELAEGVRVKVQTATLSDVISRGDAKRIEKEKKEEAKADDKNDSDDGDSADAASEPAAEKDKKPLFSFGSKK